MIIRTYVYATVFAIFSVQVWVIPALAEPLTEQNISQFAQTWTPLTARLMSVDQEFDPQNSAGLVGQLQQMAQTDGPDSARDGAVSADGYVDFETWAKTASQIITAAHWAKDPVDTADIEQAIAAINSDDIQNVDEKEQLVADIKAAYEIARKQKPQQTDIDLVKRMLPLLEPIVWPVQ